MEVNGPYYEININNYANKDENWYIEQFKIKHRMLAGLINEADNNYDICNALYAYGKTLGPDFIWEHYSHLVIMFWGDFKYDNQYDILIYSPYVEFFNYINYDNQ